MCAMRKNPSLNSPDKRFSPMSFWLLNHDLEDDEIRWQLREMKEKGFKGVFLHPRDGLETPYQSDLWWQKVQLIIDTCRQEGLHAWMYDEDPFPSGVAGGRVFADNATFKAKEMRMDTAQASGGRFRMVFPLTGYKKVYAIRKENGQPTRDWLDITSSAGVVRYDWQQGYIHHNIYYPPYSDFGNPHWRCATANAKYTVDTVLPEGDWLICAFYEQEIRNERWGGYTDLMNKEAVQYFIKLTHEELGQRYGEDFGELIPGIFTDEPKVNGLVSWTRAFPEFFSGFHGYSVEEHLPDLFFTVDEQSAQIRHDYRLAISKLFIESYMVPIEDWCESHNIISTGHISPEEDPVGQTQLTPYLMSILKHFHLPGTDLIAGTRGNHNYPLLHMGPKIASSASHHAGRGGVICESFGANGWDLDVQEMLRMANWLFVMGVTDIVTHGQYYSIDGLRKKEAPPSQFYQSGHWPFFGPYMDYLGGMADKLRAGAHRCRLLVYYPQATFSAYFPDRQDDLNRCRKELGDFVHHLLRHQWDFDFVDEETLLGMTASEGKINGTNTTYDILLLANCDYLESGTMARCQQLIGQGANIWLVGSEPKCLQTKTDWNGQAYYSRQIEKAQLLPSLESNVANRWYVTAAQGDGKQAMEDIYLQTRELKNGTRLFMMNELDDQWRNCKLCGPAFGNHGSDITFCLGPQGSLMIDVSHTGEISFPWGEGQLDQMSISAGQLTNLGAKSKWEMDIDKDWTLTPQGPNVLNLADWHIWDHDPMANNASFTGMPARNLITQGHTAIGREGKAHWALCRFYTKGTPTAVELVGEQGGIQGDCSFCVNGQPIGPMNASRYFDCKNLSTTVTDFIHDVDGTTSLNWVQAAMGENSAMTEPLRLYGQFRVYSPYPDFPPALIRFDEPLAIACRHLQPWHELGYPHYSGTMRYEKTVQIDGGMLGEGEKTYLYAEHLCDLGELTVNGQSAGVRYGDYAVWDITPLLAQGANTICLDVANSAVSLLEARRKNAGLLGDIKIIRI